MNLGAFTAPPISHAQKSRTRPVAKPESKAVVAVPVQPRQIFRPVEDLPLIEERDHLDKRVNSVAVLKGKQREVTAVKAVQRKTPQRRRTADVRKHVERNGAAVVPLPSQFEIRLADEGAAFPGEDRKSTRLNSSHVRISYAVFCLKKKISTACL